MIHFRRIPLVCALAALPSWSWSTDQGYSKTGAPYLNWPSTARSIALGSVRAIALDPDLGSTTGNPALLPLLEAHTVTATSGFLDVDRKYLYTGYALPLRQRRDPDEDMDWSLSQPRSRKKSTHKEFDSMPSMIMEDVDFGTLENKPDKKEDFLDEAPRQKASRRHPYWDHVFAADFTRFGIGGIERRDEYGARGSDFDDSETAISLHYACRPTWNYAFGLGGKYLTHRLESAKATGFGIDAGLWYQFPEWHGTWSTALAAQDLMASYKWKIQEPGLDSEYSYSEPIAQKYRAGFSWESTAKRTGVLVDFTKATDQSIQVHLGGEYRTGGLSWRGGWANDSPSAGFGYQFRMKQMTASFDYAYQYDLEGLASPHWITLTAKFLPQK